MNKIYQNRLKRNKLSICCALGGFTLIELLVVVLIIGVLAAIAVPQYQVAVMKSRVAQVLPFLAGIKTAQDAYYMANGKYSDRWDELDVTVPAGATVRDCLATGDLHPSQCLDFPSGVSCEIRSAVDIIYCYNNDGMIPKIGFIPTHAKTSEAGKGNFCIVPKTDDVQNKVCKALGGTLSEEIGTHNYYLF